VIAVVRRDVRAVLRDRVVVRRAIVTASALVVVVCVAANTVWRPTNVVVQRVPDARVDVPADAVAQSFVAAWLMVDPDDPDARARALESFGDVSAWRVSSSKAELRRSVVATQLAGVSVRADNGDRIVTVQAQLSTGHDEYVAVRTRTRDQVVRIVGAPAIVGAPKTETAIESRETTGDEAPAEVVDVVTRAMRHLLAGRREDLAPDLAPDASVSVPASALELVDVVSATWVSDPSPDAGSLSARVSAVDADGVELSLDFELDLVKTGQGRWQLAVIHIPAS
jgi:hypothetical protein